MNCKNILLLSLVLVSLSCKNQSSEGDVLSKEDVESLDATGTNDIDKVNFNGRFEGVVDGKPYNIKINDENFTLEYNGKTHQGKAYITGDGNILELEDDENAIEYKYLGWSDDNQLLVLDKDGNYPEKEIFLNRK